VPDIRQAPAGRVAGKAALVTGAGSGIGRAVAERLAEEGAAVAALSRTRAELEEACAGIERRTGAAPLSLAADVADEAAVAEAVAVAVAAHGRIDVLVSNAGVELVHEPALGDTTTAEWEHVLSVNLTGAFHVVRAAWPHLTAGASIVTVGSLNSLHPRAGAAAYAASKGGLLQLTRAVALELAPRGIRANCVCPGVIDTPLTDAFVAAASDPAAARAAYAAEAPLGRMGTAREVADAVLFLASDESRFVTGTALVVDGGMSIS
jgi:3-oxoacyl-[acyl-carrier protein] reductase